MNTTTKRTQRGATPAAPPPDYVIEPTNGPEGRRWMVRARHRAGRIIADIEQQGGRWEIAARSRDGWRVVRHSLTIEQAGAEAWQQDAALRTRLENPLLTPTPACAEEGENTPNEDIAAEPTPPPSPQPIRRGWNICRCCRYSFHSDGMSTRGNACPSCQWWAIFGYNASTGYNPTDMARMLADGCPNEPPPLGKHRDAIVELITHWTRLGWYPKPLSAATIERRPHR